MSWYVENLDQLKNCEQAVRATHKVESNQRSVHGQLYLRDDSLSLPLRYEAGVSTSPPYIHAPFGDRSTTSKFCKHFGRRNLWIPLPHPQYSLELAPNTPVYFCDRAIDF